MVRLIAILATALVPAVAQTTQGLIAGRVVDSNSGRPISGAQVAYTHAETDTAGVARSGTGGYYVLPLLPPGRYRIRATSDRYQPREVRELELPVAGRLDLDFKLRPLADVWETGRFRSYLLPDSESVVSFFGPDVDFSRIGSFVAPRGLRGGLESTVSQVIDPVAVRELPLAGRDVYTVLVTQPGVTADAGTTRGLGLSINGQRPSASNFLLDGLENNNYLTSGPLTAIAPEAIQEYRVSISSFSAEYGRTAGFLANSITRSGGGRWHGVGYFHLKNDVLNANGFRQNLNGLPRPPLKENQLGFHAGGPLRPRSWFFSSAYERLRSRARAEAEEFLLPTPLFRELTTPSSIARRLLERFPSPAPESSLAIAGIRIAPTVSIDRSLALERLDYVSPGGAHRVMGRLAVARLSRPDFIWSPYKDFVSGLDQNTYGVALSVVSTLRPTLTQEMRFGGSRDTLGWDRAHSEIPTLGVGDGTVLPSSPAFYAFRNRSRSFEFAGSLVWAPGRHVMTAGGGFLFRWLSGFLTAGRDGGYFFDGFFDFTVDRPNRFSAAVSRQALPALSQPQYGREYRYRQFHLFAQDTFRMTPRLTLNVGVRYENPGAPRNTGPVPDARVELGRITYSGGDLYQPDNRDWAGRFGFSWDPWGRGSTLLRGAYGIFYDRPFDNLWLNVRNNNFVLPYFVAQRGDYLAPIASVLPRYQGQDFAGDFPRLTSFEPRLRNGYTQSWFLGGEKRLGEDWTVEINALGALGRRLLTTDLVNRQGNPIIAYRGAQGLSSYHALTAVARYRARRAQLQAAYTWSHSIDLQSDPLASDFFDLGFTRLTSAGDSGRARAAFTRQFDSHGDRASSDFDQRHNLVFFSVLELPAVWHSGKAHWLFRNWRVSQLAAFRTGFPYSTFAASTIEIFNNRADLVAAPESQAAAPGGRRLLNPAAFRQPPAGRVGNTGRNAFHGPGLYNVDLSLSRSFSFPWPGESGRLSLRADFFNALNHVNLNPPDSVLASPTFGIATYGRRGRDTGFPALAPFQETPRQVQVILRIEF